MTRISQAFERLRANGEKALITYVMAGHLPQRDTLSVLRGMIDGGADIIELGFPFSDPLADGGVIQGAAAAALKRGTSMSDYFALVKKIRKETDIPLVLMTYTNILYRAGYSKFIGDAVNAGIDGLILPDMSIEESAEYTDAARGMADTIFLVSPNTSRKRLQAIAKKSTGFLYLVAVYGTTGAGGNAVFAPDAIRRAKRTVRGLPVGIGFGVATPSDVKRYVQAGADAVIVGSAFLRLIERTGRGDLRGVIAAFTRSLKRQTKP